MKSRAVSFVVIFTMIFGLFGFVPSITFFDNGSNVETCVYATDHNTDQVGEQAEYARTYYIDEEVMKKSVKQSSASNDVNYSYNSQTKTLTFKGTGMIEGRENHRNLPWYKYADKAEKLVIKDGITGVGNFAFREFKKLKDIDFPDEMTYLGQECFAFCYSLTEVVLPDGVVQYEGGIFDDCINLKKVVYGAGNPGIFVLGNDFRGCKKLKTIEVSPLNSAFFVKDGALYGRGGAYSAGPTLLAYPAAKSGDTYVLPEDVTEIGDFAITDAKFLRKVKLHDNLVAMGLGIESCQLLKNLTIPASLQHLYGDDTFVFQFCENLKKVINKSNVKIEFGGEALFDGSGYTFWKNKETGKYIRYMKKGTAISIRHGIEKCEGQTFKVKGVTYEVVGDTNYESTLSQINSKTPVAKVKAVSYSQGFKLQEKPCYQNWYYKVTSVKIKKPTATPEVKAKLYGYNDVKLTWQKIKNCYGYKVYYKKASADKFVLYKRVSTNSIKIENLKSGTKYVFKVKPYIRLKDKTYNGKVSEIKSICTLKKVSKPKVKKVSSSKIKLIWKDIDGETGYQIGRSKTKTGEYKVIATLKKDKESVTAKKNKDAKYYRIRAYRTVNGKKIFAPWSDVTFVK